MHNHNEANTTSMKPSLILLLCVILTSCTLISPKTALKRAGIFDTQSELKIIGNEQQNVIFIGMHHIGKQEFYDDVAAKIDSLQQLNHTVFYESVSNDKNADSLTSIKSFMKLRKLMGYLPITYLDTTNNKIGNKIKYNATYDLVNQPNYSALKVDHSTAIKADVSITELITAFEKNEGVIRLDSCDLSVKLTDKNYNCKKAKQRVLKTFWNEYLKDYREQSLAKQIVESGKENVVVIYGDAHFWGLYTQLKALDDNYRLKKYKTIGTPSQP